MANDFRNRSKSRFASDMEKFIKDLYVSCLDRAEKILRPDKRGEAWKQFRFGILNLGNDKIRQMYDRLEDYSIEFRPAIFSVEYTVDVPVSKIVEFEFKADGKYEILFSVKSANADIILQLDEAIGGSTLAGSDNKSSHVGWTGLYSAFHKVIPFFDKNECFKGKTLERYNAWKEKVYAMEKANA